VTSSTPLPALAEELFTRMTTRSGTPVEFETHRRGPPLSPRVEQEVWRILQEAVTNIERHAQATHVRVTWSVDPMMARLEIVDDGVGWVGPEPSGFGLQGMVERADAIGARLDIDGQRDLGTRVLLELDRRQELA
jgi:signal transduction histidine kinase